MSSLKIELFNCRALRGLSNYMMHEAQRMAKVWTTSLQPALKAQHRATTHSNCSACRHSKLRRLDPMEHTSVIPNCTQVKLHGQCTDGRSDLQVLQAKVPAANLSFICLLCSCHSYDRVANGNTELLAENDRSSCWVSRCGSFQ